MRLLLVIKMALSALGLLASLQVFAAHPCPGGPGPNEVQVGNGSYVPGEVPMCETRTGSDATYNPYSMIPVFRDIAWGALAIDKEKLLVTDKEMKFIGVARDEDMKKAKKAALAMCASDGSSNCKIVETALNLCLAISISPKDNKLAYVFAPNRQMAVDQSLGQCNQQYQTCKIAYTDC